MNPDQDQFERVLRKLDHALPKVTAADVMATARSRDLSRFRWAAGIIMVLGIGGLAYAAPGSPLTGWIDTLVRHDGDRPRSQGSPPVQAPESPAAGIAITPGRNLVILFVSHQPSGRAKVSVTDASEVVVRGTRGAASYTSDADQLVIDNTGSAGTFEIEVPRAAPRVEIRLRGVSVFVKEGSRITTARSASADGQYLIELTHAHP